MIATLSEIKKLLRLTDSTYNTEIEMMLPLVQQYIVNATNNRFLNEKCYYSATTIAFVNGSPATITDSESKFVSVGHFHDNMNIFVSGSYHNDGYYTVQTAASGTLTLQDMDSVIDESAERLITIYKVDFPADLKQVAAKMIDYNLQKISNVKSESVGDYSVTYADIESAGYPKAIISALSTHRRIKWH